MAEGAVVEVSEAPVQSPPLVEMSFQRNDQRKEKFLEAEPKALGITQISLSVYTVLGSALFLSNGLSRMAVDVIVFISSVLVMIAGSLAVAAQSLHLPTLKACLGMQLVACGASLCNLVCNLVKMEEFYHYYCPHHYDDNSTTHRQTCMDIENVQSHFYAGGMLVQTTVLALSVTLTVYCCKVVPCCGPAPKMPVITVYTGPVQP